MNPDDLSSKRNRSKLPVPEVIENMQRMAAEHRKREESPPPGTYYECRAGHRTRENRIFGYYDDLGGFYNGAGCWACFCIWLNQKFPTRKLEGPEPEPKEPDDK